MRSIFRRFVSLLLVSLLVLTLGCGEENEPVQPAPIQPASDKPARLQDEPTLTEEGP